MKSRLITLFLMMSLMIGSSAFVSGCASSNQVNHSISGYEEQVNDPFEPVNRSIFALNGVLDTFIIRPVAYGYREALPQQVRDSIRNFLRNLRAPINLANNVFQGDLSAAGNTVKRFMVNTTAGVGGLFDVADSKLGIPYVQEDFGQTMAVYGVPSGPYVVIPILGSSTVRDVTGMALDMMADPLFWYARNSDNNSELFYGKIAVTAIDSRARLIDPLDELKENSLDYYAAMRSVYIQFREAQIRNKARSGTMGEEMPMQTSGTFDIPDFDEYDD